MLRWVSRVRRAPTGPLLVAALALSGCHSPGKYGHSRVYSPLDAEEDAAAQAVEYDPVMAQRSPAEWRGKGVSVFGVVTSRKPGSGGTADLELSLRRLEKRNLCSEEAEDSCRVTVSDREHGRVHVLVSLEQDDDIGRESVGNGSLLRVIGRISDSVDPESGAAVLQASYYRHWPRGTYVSSAQRDQMRR